MKRRNIFKIAALLIGVPLLLLTIVLLYLNFADLSGWRDTLASVVSDAIGRELKINGEFKAEIGFTTRVVASDITLANSEWSDDPHMVSVDRLTGEIDLLSLLFGPITIRDVEISGARVLFETGTEGRFNWALGSGESDGGDGGDVELVISHALLNDLQLVYTQPQKRELEALLSKLELTDDGTGMLDLDLTGSIKETPIEISGRLGTFMGLINAAAVEHDLTGRFADTDFALDGSIEDLSSLSGVTGDVSFRGLDISTIAAIFSLDPLFDGPFSVEASVGRTDGGSDFNLDASVGEITAKTSGTVDSLVSPGALDITVDATGPDVAAIAAVLGVDDMPPKSFAVSGRVKWAGFPITCENVDVRVGENTLSAHGVVGEPPLMVGTDFTFSGGGPDISAIAALAGLETQKDRYSIRGRLVRIDEAIRIDNVEFEVGDVTLGADGTVGDPPEYHGTALTLHGQGPDLKRLEHVFGVELPAGHFEIGGKLVQGDGAIDLEGVRGRLDRTTIQVDGQLSIGAGFTGSDLRLHGDGPDASQIAAFAGLSDVPAEKFSVDGRVRILDRGYRVSDLVASLGTLGVTVDGFVADPPQLIGSDLRIHVEDSDLSHPASIAGIAGLPHDAFKIDTRVRIEESGYRLDDFQAGVGDMELEADGLIGAPPELEGTQVHVTARGPKLSSLNQYVDQTGLPAAPFSVSGNARVTDGAYVFDHMVAEVDGNRVTLNGTVQPVQDLVGTDLEIEVSAPDLRRAGGLVTGFTDLPELPAQPLTLTTRLAIDATGYEVDNLRATLARARVAIDGRVGAPPDLFGTDLTIDGDGPDASLFKALTGVTIPVTPFQLNGRVERNEAGFRFHRVTSRLGEYRATVDGSLGELPKLIGTDLEIHASGPDTGLIRELAGLPNFPDQPFELEGEFTGIPERFATRKFTLTFGPSDVEGSFTVDITGKPDVHARLTSSHLDLSHLRERVDRESAGTEDAAKPSVSAKRERVISDEPFDLAMLRKADADVVVRIDEIVLPTNRLHDVGIDLRLDDGRLEIKRITAVGSDQGSVSGNLVLEPIGDQHRLRTRLDARQLRLDLPGSPLEPTEQPPFDIAIDLEARGATPHELASSANGLFQVVIGKGVMDSGVVDLVTADILLTLLNAFNPFAKEEEATELQCGVVLVNFENGLATLDPMAFQSDKMTMLGKGRIEFGTEKLNLDWVTKPRKGIGISASMITNPYISLGGTLAKPAIEIKPMEAVAQTSVAVATLGLSLVAKGMYDRVTAEKKVCKNALEEIGLRDGGSTKKPRKKK